MDEKSFRNRGVGFEEIPDTPEIPLTPGVYYPRKKTHKNCKTSRQRRVMFRNGELNIEEPAPKYWMADWFINMVLARWRWTLLNFFAGFIAVWFIFGCVYWFIALCHGDFSFSSTQNSTYEPCIINVDGLTSAFLFSIEVDTAVASPRVVTVECPQAIIATCLQSVFSSIFQAIMVGILVAKLTRPKPRMQSVVFSKHAVVNLRDEKLCLIFRVGDMKKDRILNIKVSLFLIRTDLNTADNYEQIEMATELDGCESTFFLFPLSVIHVIDKKSPFYKISAADLLCERLEMFAIFEGTIETTGQLIQARASFTEHDIRWGYRFVPMLHGDVKKKVLDVNFAKLNKTEPIDTPLCSPWEYDEVSSVVSFISKSEEFES